MDPVTQAGQEAVAEARDVILFLAPGFIALKIFQVLGTQTKRSEWEWTAWSILVAAGIAALIPEPGGRIVAGIVLGFALAIVWRTIPRWWLVGEYVGPWIARNLSNSVWDLVLQLAERDDRVIEVELGEGDDRIRFFGEPWHYSYEAYESEPWLYLGDAQRRVGNAAYQKLDRTEGVLIHRDNIKWLRVLEKDPEGGD